MPSFGQKLKAEREKRSITLDQISQTTKIGTRMLQALEEDKFSQLPGGIFNKGFVRAYARCIGIDEDQAVSDYLNATGEAAPARAETELDASAGASANKRSTGGLPALEAEASSNSREIPWGLFAALLLVIALALSVWTHRKHETTQPSTPRIATGSAPSASSSSEPSAAGSVDSKKLETATSAPADHSTPAIAAKENPGKKVESASGSAGSPQPAGAQPGEFTVAVHGREDCWISITADGKAVASYMLPAGEQRVARGRQSVIIKAGNAGGLDVLFNGQRVGLQGTSGEVKTLIFGPEGLEASSTAPQSAQ